MHKVFEILKILRSWRVPRLSSDELSFRVVGNDIRITYVTKHYFLPNKILHLTVTCYSGRFCPWNGRIRRSEAQYQLEIHAKIRLKIRLVLFLAIKNLLVPSLKCLYLTNWDSWLLNSRICINYLDMVRKTTS